MTRDCSEYQMLYARAQEAGLAGQTAQYFEYIFQMNDHVRGCSKCNKQAGYAKMHQLAAEKRAEREAE
jgi:hypothetical protein